MAGEAGDALGARMAAVAETLATLVERDARVLTERDPPTDPAGVDKSAKAIRAVALAGRGVADLTAAARRLQGAPDAGADPGPAEDDGEADAEDEGLVGDALEALRCDVERRYARFDRAPGDKERHDPSHGWARPAPGAGGVAGDGPAGPAPA